MSQACETEVQALADPAALSSVAALMSTEEDWTIFRRFDEFHILNLLTLQDEIQSLGEEVQKLHPQMVQDVIPDPDAWYTSAHPLANRKQSTMQNEADKRLEARRKYAWGKLKAKLKEYSKLKVLFHHT